MAKTIYSLLLMFHFWAAQAQVQLTFSLEVPNEISVEKIGITGSRAPLDGQNPVFLEKVKEQNRYTATISFGESLSGSILEYQYSLWNQEGKKMTEFEGQNLRFCFVEEEGAERVDAWNDYPELPARALANMPANAIAEDLTILREALLALHPGLYRYHSPIEIEQLFSELQEKLNQPAGYRTVYREIAAFLAKIKCGHTYANFSNQNALIRSIVLEQADKLPFTYQLAGSKMVATGNASDCPFIQEGTEIFTINKLPVEEVLQRVAALVPADGNNQGARIYQLDLKATVSSEAMDAYFPLVFPPQKRRYSVTGARAETGQRISCSLTSERRQVRNQNLLKNGKSLQPDEDALWKYDRLSKEISYLKVGSFVAGNLKTDWKDFLKNTFSRINDEKIPNLVIDIRGSKGGNKEVVNELMHYLVTEKVKYQTFDQRTRFKEFPASLRPFVEVLDASVFEMAGQVKNGKAGFFRVKGVKKWEKLYPSNNSYSGKVYLLVGPENSSASFFLAHYLKTLKRATLIGTETGGNLNGINGEKFVMLHLPNSGIEVDIPLIGYFARTEQPDQGIMPDVVVEKTVADLQEETDPVLDYIRENIR